MVDLPGFHDHSNCDLYEIEGEVKNLQVQFGKRDATVDFFIMESTNQGNVVLGRDILRAMKGFIDIGKGQIHLCGKAKVSTSSLGKRLSYLLSPLHGLAILLHLIKLDLFCFVTSSKA